MSLAAVDAAMKRQLTELGSDFSYDEYFSDRARGDGGALSHRDS